MKYEKRKQDKIEIEKKENHEINIKMKILSFIVFRNIHQYHYFVFHIHLLIFVVFIDMISLFFTFIY